ncbi:MAG: J domain-containing protein [Candidatus Latescibacteria bacterium]|nr:J domain-containing protein [Candidatus Latescibacterota bacterium]
MAKNYYIILGLSSDASREDIQTAYRRLAKQYHPDHYGTDSGPFLQIQEAYSVLSNPDAKRQYDHSMRPVPRGGLFRDVTEETLSRRRHVEAASDAPQDVFLTRSFQTYSPSYDEIFDRLWSNFSSMQRTKSETGRPLTAEIVLSHEQALYGGSVRVFVPARATCPTCKGYGGVGPWECWRCAGEGSISGEFPILIEYPAGITDGHTTLVSLENMGISNLYLTVMFRVIEKKEDAI